MANPLVLPTTKLVHDRTNGYWLLLVQTFPGVYQTVSVVTQEEIEAVYGKNRKA